FNPVLSISFNNCSMESYKSEYTASIDLGVLGLLMTTMLWLYFCSSKIDSDEKFPTTIIAPAFAILVISISSYSSSIRSVLFNDKFNLLSSASIANLILLYYGSAISFALEH